MRLPKKKEFIEILDLCVNPRIETQFSESANPYGGEGFIFLAFDQAPAIDDLIHCVKKITKQEITKTLLGPDKFLIKSDYYGSYLGPLTNSIEKENMILLKFLTNYTSPKQVSIRTKFAADVSKLSGWLSEYMKHVDIKDNAEDEDILNQDLEDAFEGVLDKAHPIETPEEKVIPFPEQETELDPEYIKLLDNISEAICVTSSNFWKEYFYPYLSEMESDLKSLILSAEKTRDILRAQEGIKIINKFKNHIRKYADKLNNYKMEKESLDFSQISLLLKCPKQYYYRYKEKIKTPGSIEMVISVVWHQTLQRFFTEKMITKTNLPLEILYEDYEIRFRKYLLENEVPLDPGTDINDILTYMKSVIKLHYESLAVFVNPIAVEASFQIDLGSHFPFNLKGRWDLIDDQELIRDHKLYGKTPTIEAITNDLQFTTYCVGYRLAKKKIEKGIMIDAVIKNKTPKLMSMMTTRTNEDCRWTFKLLEDLAIQIQKEVFPCNPEGWWCSENWCGYYQKCKPHKVTVAVPNKQEERVF